MSIYIALLRGVNVGGRKLPMADLRLMLEGMKYKDVSTYIQSGNIIFSSSKNAAALSKEIEKAIAKEFSLDVPVIIRTSGEMKGILKSNPFLKDKSVKPEFLHVTLLGSEPEPNNIEKTNGYDYPPDKFIISGSEVYLYCPGGYGNTKLNNTFFESKLKVKTTTRNWKTMNELVNRSAELK